MKVETTINLIANIIIFCSVITYIILVYGKTQGGIWSNKYNAMLGKLALAVNACGALLNIVTLSTPNITEVIQNFGLSLTLVWIALHQYKTTNAVLSEDKTVVPANDVPIVVTTKKTTSVKKQQSKKRTPANKKKTI